MKSINIFERFKDRLEAGELLARRLSAFYRHQNAIVVALPRGGVPVGYAVAKLLELPLDILLVKKLSLPGNEEYAIGAISSNGTCILRENAVSVLDIRNQVIEAAVQRRLNEMDHCESIYRKHHRSLDLEGRNVILVDDGVATGATMEVAAHVVRAAKPESLIIAVPVATPEICKNLQSTADEIICLQTPERFCAVGKWYLNFEQITDEEVATLLEIGDESAPADFGSDTVATR
jgi:putative phosphoribosyl transferase